MKILLVGTYSSQNKGDAAMELSAAQSLNDYYKKKCVTISTPFPTLDARFYSNFPIVKCNRRRLFFATFQLFRCAVWSGFYKLFKLNFKLLIPDQEIQEFLESDLIVDLSGDMQTEDYGPHVAYSHYIPLLMAYFLGRPFVLCAQSIGPFKWTIFIARFILENAKLITVRDELSLSYLKEKIKIKNENIKMTADMAFLLKPADDYRINEILRMENILIGRKKLLGVSLSNLVMQKYKSKNPYSSTKDFYSLFANVLDNFAEKHNLDIVFIPHVTGPTDSKNDRLVGDKLSSYMKSNIFNIVGDYGPDEFKGIIRKFDYMIGARMHANIAALSSGIPTVAISYSHKTPGIMTMLGQQDYILDILNLDENDVSNKLSSIMENSTKIKKTLNKKLPKVKVASFENIELINDIIFSHKVKK